MADYIQHSKQEMIRFIQSQITYWEYRLTRYNRFAQENPDSIFYRWIVKNTKETIQELKDNLKQLESELKK